ncbi:DEAD/DEAH box helicase [Schaalia radingae]|uniref:SNF2 family N-terminal domain-containing protein n=1 Tax=Schaalia radingae TaxID=131110 RepID=A0ABY0V4Y4_9ACTO|nr:DEAD/DEAH box helicase [Schaalia radingae]SDT85784.1 SNF2 family N-terminal domain-containing protein [Schaalia radingae]
MKYKPHDYQLQATRFIVEHKQAALLLQMGLGKTVITLTAVKQLFDDFAVDRVLIVAPLRVARDTWPDEIRKWDHLKGLSYSVIVGTREERIEALKADADVYIVNRENIPWLVNTVRGWPFDMIILDEMSSFKNHQSKRFKALRKARPHVRRIVGLTGTPAPNGLLDLWAQYRLLDEGVRLGTRITKYRDRYFDPDKRSQTQIFTYKPKPGGENAIYERIRDITLSMKTSDHLQLPPVTYTRRVVTMSPGEQQVYDRLKRDMVVSLGGSVVDAANAAVLSGKLLQLASGAIYSDDGEPLVVHSRKLDALEDIVEAANGQPVMVAYWFKHDAERILERFPSAVELKSSEDFHRWNAGNIPLALIHPASAGHGLNLQHGGHILVWFSLTWSLELYQQANARLYRQGQSWPVSVVHVVCSGSIDEQVLDALERKDTSQSALVDAVRASLDCSNVRG